MCKLLVYPHLAGWMSQYCYIPTWLVDGCMYESLVIGRSFMMYKVMFLIVEHLLADLAYSQGESGYHNRAEISACTQGELNPFPLMTKGENDFEWLGVAIKSKGGDCWHYDTGLALWHTCCTWWQLTQMKNHSSSSRNEGERDIRKFLLTKSHIHMGSPIKRRVYICTHFHGRKSAYMWENLTFGPWYLVLGIWTYVFGPWYLIWSVEPRYWVHGIDSLQFWTMVLSKA